MGNTVCTDKHVLTTEELQSHRLKFRPNAPQLKDWEESNSFAGYEHNIRAFSFQFNKNNQAGSSSASPPVKVSRSGVATVPMNLGEDIQLDPTHSYVIMHLQRVPANKAHPPKGYDYPTPDEEFQSFAKTCDKTFTPRGISAMFSVDISALKRRAVVDTTQQPFVYLFKLYVYNGKKASSLVSAVAVMSAFTIEKLLLKNSDFVAALFYNGLTSQTPTPFHTPQPNSEALSSSSSARGMDVMTMFRDHAFLRSFYNMLSPSEQAMNNTQRSITSTTTNTGTSSPNQTLRKPLVPSLGIGGASAHGSINKLPSGFNLNLTKIQPIITEDHDDVKPSRGVPPLGGGIPKIGGIGLGLNLTGLGSKIQEAKAAAAAENDDVVPDEENPNAREERLLALKFVSSEVYPKVYVGGEHARTMLEDMVEQNISVVVNAVGSVGPGTIPNLHPKEFQYLNLQLSDDPTETIDAFFPLVNHLIHTTRTEKNEGVFIHCHQGVSRSATLALAYMMWAEGINFETARLNARNKRNIISPNSGFIARLINWAKFLSSPPNRVLFQFTRYNKRFPVYCYKRVQAQSSTENIIDTASCYCALEREDSNKPYKMTFYSGPLVDETIVDDARELLETLMPFTFYTGKPNVDDGVEFKPVTFDFEHVTELRSLGANDSSTAASFSHVAERVLGVPVVISRLDPNADLDVLNEQYYEMLEERRMQNEGASRRKRSREGILEDLKRKRKEEAEAAEKAKSNPPPPAITMNLGSAPAMGGLGLKLGGLAAAPIAPVSDLNEVHVYEYPFDGDDQNRIDFIDRDDLQPDQSYCIVFIASTEDASHEIVLYKGSDSDVTDEELIQAYMTHFVEAEDLLISTCKPTPAGEIQYSVVTEGNLPSELSRRIE